MILGIVGFGVVGKSVLSFLVSFRHDARLQQMLGTCDFSLAIWDERALTPEEHALLATHGVNFVFGKSVDLEGFFDQCDLVVPSPGVNINAFKHRQEKIFCELDFFTKFFTKPVVAVTGTLGKTTTVTLLGKLVEQCSTAVAQACEPLFTTIPLRVAVGGNIGKGMLDLASHEDDYDCAILELSSWQLECSKNFAPTVAVLTNIYPNHLDRHETMEAYEAAKYALFAQQTQAQWAVLPAEVVLDRASFFHQHCQTLRSRFVITTSHDWASSQTDLSTYSVVCVRKGVVTLCLVEQGVERASWPLIACDSMPTTTFCENWLTMIAAIFAGGLSPEWLARNLPAIIDSLGENPYGRHRVEHFATVRGVDFYDDSKSTVIQATQAAVTKLAVSGKPLIVILGGLSKGVDREPLMQFIASVSSIKKVYCFGKDCDQLKGCSYLPTLDAVVDDVMTIMQPGDQVLLSPSGASFDLFTNYQQRGKIFKELVLQRANGL